MNSSVEVSVVMCVYSEKEYWIKEAIDSILSQTFSDFEFIIVNDNPNDSVIDKLIKSYTDSRIKYHRNIANYGLAKSLNIAIRLAEGEFIARMDADDISFIDRLEKQILFFNNSKEIDLVGCQARIINEIGAEGGLLKCPITSEEVKVSALFGVPFIHPTVMFRKKVFSEYNFYYNEDFSTAQDFELWTRFVHRLNGVNLAEPLLYYRQSNQQITSSKVSEQTAFFMSAAVTQLERLGVEISEDQKVLLNRMSRNKTKESLDIYQVVKLRKLLEEIFNIIPTRSKYDLHILRKHLFVNFATTLLYYKGNFFSFIKEVIIFLKNTESGFKNSLILYTFLIKIKLVTIKNTILSN